MVNLSNREVVDLSTYDNSWYSPGNKFKIFLWMICSAIFFNNSWSVINSLKVIILKLFGAKVGKSVVIKPSVNIKYPWKLKIGDYTWLGENVWIDNLEFISIGKNVCISQGAMLLTGNHDYSKATFDLIVRSIILEDGVWISAKSVVCPGTICESHSVLSVQSVISKRMNAYTIYQGNPALPIKGRSII